MEQFDVLDATGKWTGKVKDKGTKLNDGEFYVGVHVYIYNSSNEFLIQQRSFNKTILPGCWDIHMGHVIAGETSKETAVREVKEEIGLTLNEKDICFLDRSIWETYHRMTDIFFVKVNVNIQDLILQEDEVIDVKFVSIDEMVNFVSNMDHRHAEYRELVINKINSMK